MELKKRQRGVRNDTARRPRCPHLAFMFTPSSTSSAAVSGSLSDVSTRSSSFQACSCSPTASSFLTPTNRFASLRDFSTCIYAPQALERNVTRNHIGFPVINSLIVSKVKQTKASSVTKPNNSQTKHKGAVAKKQAPVANGRDSTQPGRAVVRSTNGTKVQNRATTKSIRHRRRKELRDFFHMPVHLVDSVLIHGSESERHAYLSALMNGGQTMSVLECNQVLSNLRRLGRMRDALALIRVWEQRPLSDVLIAAKAVKTFTIMIDVCGKSHQLARAYSLFHVMRRGAVLPNVITYNSMISACARNNEPELASELFEDMKLQGLQPDKFTYGALIDCYAKSGEVDKAFKVAEIMEKDGVRKDQTIYSALMDACGRAMQLGRAFEVFEEMKRRGVWPNLITFSVLIDTCANAREPEMAFQLFSEIKHWGYPKANVVVYTALIDACSKAGWPARAELVMKNMIENGIRPNEITYGALMDSWTKEGNLDQAFRIMDRMVNDHGITPNAILIGALIESCRRCADYTRAKTAWGLMLKYNLRPSKLYYPCLICMTARNGDVDVASAITLHAYARGSLRRASLQGEHPLLYSLGCAIVFLRHKILTSAECSEQLRENLMNRLRVVFNSTAITAEEMDRIDPQKAFQACMTSFSPQNDSKPHSSGSSKQRNKK